MFIYDIIEDDALFYSLEDTFDVSFSSFVYRVFKLIEYLIIRPSQLRILRLLQDTAWLIFTIDELAMLLELDRMT